MAGQPHDEFPIRDRSDVEPVEPPKAAEGRKIKPQMGRMLSRKSPTEPQIRDRSISIRSTNRSDRNIEPVPNFLEPESEGRVS